jgi:hypothetical protein
MLTGWHGGTDAQRFHAFMTFLTLMWDISAAWHGTRIIMRQVSAEAIEIFDFIIELYNCCSGEWGQLGEQFGLQPSDVEEFLTYAATFLSNVGNYYVYTPRYLVSRP